MRIQIADTCKVYRLGLRALLAKAPGITFAPDIERISDLLPKAEGGHADLLICNVQILGEIQATLCQLRKNKHLRTFIYAPEASCYTVQAALVNNAAGYVLMGEIEAEVPLTVIVNAIGSGRRWFSPSTQIYLLADFRQEVPTPRERELLRLMHHCLEPKAIATKMSLRVRTVYLMQSKLRCKFGVPNNVALLAATRHLVSN